VKAAGAAELEDFFVINTDVLEREPEVSLPGCSLLLFGVCS